jgi:hypothetical protein
MHKKIITAVILLMVITAAVVWFFTTQNKSADQAKPKEEQATRLDIKLRGGKLVSPAATYLVQPGVRLEFHISSNIFGKVSVPTTPSQTITFTESPLIFQFNASDKPGRHMLLYQPTGSDEVVTIGTIIVKAKE